MTATSKKKPPSNSGFLADPITKQAQIGRVDQGVDVTQSSPFDAVAGGTIVYIDPNFYKGTPAVYERLDHPVTINGRTYDEVYYSETSSLVHVGQHVTAGAPISAGGSAELGFADNNLPAAHATYHEGDVTQAGRDFLSALQLVSFESPQDRTPDTSHTTVDVGTGETSTSSGPQDPFSAALSGLEGWLGGIGKKVLAYLLLGGLAAGLFLTGLKGLGVKPPKLPVVVPA